MQNFKRKNVDPKVYRSLRELRSFLRGFLSTFKTDNCDVRLLSKYDNLFL